MDEAASVRQAEAGDAFRATVTVGGEEPFLAGHYPGFPLVPGFLLVQYVHDLVTRSAGLPEGPVVLERARFFGPVGPGEQIGMEVRLVGGQGEVRAMAELTTGAGRAARVTLRYPGGHR
ncbi:hypothetical protein GCM10009716_42420 [Streptomyces sodiiphilus]|uniref:ApeI dehydratase-like domain-containing protein n=1 Tax=Streptomyces sodiiphilus TaxID=226217 RepID=A0ABP5B735_9ACTN